MTIERRFIEEKVKELEVKEYLRKQIGDAGYSDTVIKRTPMGTHVIIRAMRPGLVIGTAGENVDNLTKRLTSMKLDNPHIEVQTVEQPDIDAKVVSWKIGKLLERGFYFKSVAMRTIDSVMRAGARGVEIRITGKVPSARARRWLFKTGYIRHCGETVKESVLVGKYTAMLKSGMLGVKVRIMPPTIVFPDEVVVKQVQEVSAGKAAVAETKPSEKPVEKKAEKKKPKTGVKKEKATPKKAEKQEPKVEAKAE